MPKIVTRKKGVHVTTIVLGGHITQSQTCDLRKCKEEVLLKKGVLLIMCVHTTALHLSNIYLLPSTMGNYPHLNSSSLESDDPPHESYCRLKRQLNFKDCFFFSACSAQYKKSHFTSRTPIAYGKIR